MVITVLQQGGSVSIELAGVQGELNGMEAADCDRFNSQNQVRI